MLGNCFLQLQKRTKPMQVSSMQVQEIRPNVLFSVWVPSPWCLHKHEVINHDHSLVNSLYYTIVKNDVNVAPNIKYFTSLKVRHYDSWAIISPKSMENGNSSVKCCFIWVILCNVHFPWFWPLTLKWPWVNFIGLSKKAKESPKYNNICLSYDLFPLISTFWPWIDLLTLNWPWDMLAFKYYVFSNVALIGPSKKVKESPK